MIFNVITMLLVASSQAMNFPLGPITAALATRSSSGTYTGLAMGFCCNSELVVDDNTVEFYQNSCKLYCIIS
jgi:hypothetical protein